MSSLTPVVDLFAGPGGLGEGFTAFNHGSSQERAFGIVVSVEKDKCAHRTLELRSFLRQFPLGERPDDYYQYISKDGLTREELFDRWPEQASKARREAMCAELGKSEDDERVHSAIRQAIESEPGKEWVLIGGPPCQVYSTAGRARMRQIQSKDPEKSRTETRHRLYREYLRIIARFRPAVFVMENVKGMLSWAIDDNHAAASDGGNKEDQQEILIFHKILRDLKKPIVAILEEQGAQDGLPDSLSRQMAEELRAAAPLGYRIHSLVVHKDDPDDLKPKDYIIRCEDYGIPQTRHRVILLGVRDDIGVTPDVLTPFGRNVYVEEVIGDLPPVRSSLSKGLGTADAWTSAIQSLQTSRWLHELRNSQPHSPLSQIQQKFEDFILPIEVREEKVLRPPQHLARVIETAARTVAFKLTTGSEFVPVITAVAYEKDWYADSLLSGICHHATRRHMVSDLHRYLFCACFGQENDFSPKMRHFPRDLLPQHKAILKAVDEGRDIDFEDRFRVQVMGKPATTVTAHIAKDGHYNIHYDPVQCRSLTVREAARVQTFPDNYFFEGGKTSQYQQVGNAVPPLLARQIAGIVYRLLEGVHATGQNRNCRVPRDTDPMVEREWQNVSVAS